MNNIDLLRTNFWEKKLNTISKRDKRVRLATVSGIILIYFNKVTIAIYDRFESQHTIFHNKLVLTLSPTEGANKNEFKDNLWAILVWCTSEQIAIMATSEGGSNPIVACKHCQHKNVQTNKFCGNCGKSLLVDQLKQPLGNIISISTYFFLRHML